MLRLALLLLLFATSSGGAQQRGPLELANAPVAPGIHIKYGADSLQFGELRIPNTSGPHPVAIVVHGGCWLAQLGDMDRQAVAMNNMRPLAAALAEVGIATWNIEYRRLGNRGGGWPGTFRDVADAADFLRTIARDHSLDLARVVAIGHSSGGHLATWIAARPKVSNNSDLYVPDPLRVVGAVNLDGPADLKATIPVQESICGRPVITELIGGPPDEQSERYLAASPAELLPLGVPQEFLTGSMFGVQIGPYEAAAKAAGDDVRSMVLPEAGHFVFIDPQSEVWPQVLSSVWRLLNASR